MRTNQHPGRGVVPATLVTVLLMLATVLVASTSSATTPASGASPVLAVPVVERVPDRPSKPAGPRPTVVLVHGAFADASGWNDVALDLLRKGYVVHAWANPLRSIANDAAYLRDFLSTITGPVILVGHSYGGAVIGEASTGNSNVEALVYVAAYAPDAGETLEQATGLGGGHTDLLANLVVRPYPDAQFPGDGDAVVNPDTFRGIFAQDVDRRLAQAMAVAQRPAALASFVIPAGEPGWATIPSYYLIAKYDHVIPPEAQAVMSARAGATTTTVRSSHAMMVSHPEKVVEYVLRADRER